MHHQHLTRRSFLRRTAIPAASTGAAIALVSSNPLATAAEAAGPETQTMRLKGCRVAIVIATGYHDHEFWFPYYRFKEEGADVLVAGPEKGTVLGEGRHGKDGLPATISHPVKEILDQRFDLLYLPGGLWAPMELRAHGPTLDLVRKAVQEDVLVAAICHAPWILVSAGVVKGRKIACPGDMAPDVTNAGGIHVRDRCVRDGNLITAVYFGYLPDHFRVLMPALVERLRQKGTGKG
jgi:protease I